MPSVKRLGWPLLVLILFIAYLNGVVFGPGWAFLYLAACVITWTLGYYWPNASLLAWIRSWLAREGRHD